MVIMCCLSSILLLLTATVIKGSTFQNHLSLPVCPRSCSCDNNGEDVSCVGSGSFQFPTGIPTTTVRLELQDYVVKEVSSKDFITLVRIEKIKLQKSHVETIENDTFIGNSKLTMLHLNQNSLTRIHSPMFNNLPYLRFLDLSSNSIEFVERAFVNLAKLDHLYLENNVLQQLTTNTFLGLSNLMYLFLDHNNISSIEIGTFKHLTSLTFLSIKNNPLITTSGLNFLESRLNNADISSASLSRLPQNLGKYVRYLRLEKNNLTHINADDFKSYSDLLLLHLDGNCLSEIKMNAFRKQERLMRIWLSYNCFTSVPQSFPPNVQRIFMTNNKITELKSYSFKGLIHLEHLLLQRNKIKVIAPCAFCDLVSLQDLNLRGNQLEDLTAGSFSNLTQLRDLDLAQNNLKHIDSRCFDGTSHLQIVRISLSKNIWHCDESIKWLSNWIKQSTDQFYDNYDIRCATPENVRSKTLMTLTQNDFYTATDIPACPRSCSCGNNGKDVRCVGHGLFQLPTGIPTTTTRLELQDYVVKEVSSKDFITLVRIKKIKLRKSHVETIENGTFIGNSKLTMLYLNQNSLTRIHSPVFNNLPNLRFLDLSSNSIEFVERAFVNLAKLDQLHLEDNVLQELTTNTFLGLSKLEYLFLDNNNISSIEIGAFKYLTSLTELSITNNPLITTSGLNFLESILDTADISSAGLSRIPQNLGKYVRYLHLEKNNLTHINDGDFERYPDLWLLYLDSNCLSEIEMNAFRKQEHLMRIWLSYNCFTSVPQSFAPNLQHIFMKNNKITELKSYSFKSLIHLEHLLLQWNKIKLIAPCAFCDLVSLQGLNLRGNQLEDLTAGTFRNLTQLRELDLAQNNLKHIDSRCFDGSSHLQTLRINLGKNMWHCGESIKWLWNWIKQSTDQFYDNYDIRCASPENVRSKTLMTLTQNDFYTATDVNPTRTFLTSKATVLYETSAVSASTEATSSILSESLTSKIALYVTTIEMSTEQVNPTDTRIHTSEDSHLAKTTRITDSKSYDLTTMIFQTTGAIIVGFLIAVVGFTVRRQCQRVKHRNIQSSRDISYYPQKDDVSIVT